MKSRMIKKQIDIYGHNIMTFHCGQGERKRCCSYRVDQDVRLILAEIHRSMHND